MAEGLESSQQLDSVERENNDVARLIDVGENKNSVEEVVKYPAYPN